MGLNKAGWRNHFALNKSDFQKEQEAIVAEQRKQIQQDTAHRFGRNCLFKDCEKCNPK